MHRDRDRDALTGAKAANQTMVVVSSVVPIGAAISGSYEYITGKPTFQGVSLSLTVDSDADAESVFAALGDGGQVQMPMTETFFATRFGMVADKFGVSWMVMAGQSK